MRSNLQGFALLTTLLLITLLTALVAQLVTVTSSEALIAKRRQQTLAHELARDSALWILADRLDSANPVSSHLIGELDRTGSASVEFNIGSVGVTARITDDGAKLNPNQWPRPDQEMMLERKLRAVGRSIGRPERVELQPLQSKSLEESAVPSLTFDQLIMVDQPLTLFHWQDGPETQTVWSDVVTLWGNGRIDLRRVDGEVLESALEDVRPNLAEAMLSKRNSDRSVDFTAEALKTVDPETRSRIQDRITFGAGRYAVTLTTAMHADRRRWYLVGTLENGRWDLLHRSAITW